MLQIENYEDSYIKNSFLIKLRNENFEYRTFKVQKAHIILGNSYY